MVVGRSHFSGKQGPPGASRDRRHEPGRGPGWARLSVASLKKLCRQGTTYRRAGGPEDPPGREMGTMVAWVEARCQGRGGEPSPV